MVVYRQFPVDVTDQDDTARQTEGQSQQVDYRVGPGMQEKP